MIPLGTQPQPLPQQPQKPKPAFGGLKPLGGIAPMGAPQGGTGTMAGGPTVQPGQQPQGPAVQPMTPQAGPTITPKPPIVPQTMSASGMAQTPGQAPDRMALVNSALSDYDAENAPGLAMRQRQVGQNAAKFGRIGAGMTTNDLTGLARGYEKDRQLFGNGLIRSGVEGTIGDQQTAIENAFRRLLVGDQLQTSGVQRNIMAGEYGQSGSPAYMEAAFSGQHAGAANDAYGSIAELLKQYAQRQAVPTPPIAGA